MNICVVYYSRFGNNAGVAEYIGKKFREKNHTVSVNSVIDTKPDALPAAELYIFCSPTMAGNAPGKIKKFVKKSFGNRREPQSYVELDYFFGEGDLFLLITLCLFLNGTFFPVTLCRAKNIIFEKVVGGL